jgi:hypothetical protein
VALTEGVGNRRGSSATEERRCSNNDGGSGDRRGQLGLLQHRGRKARERRTEIVAGVAGKWSSPQDGIGGDDGSKSRKGGAQKTRERCGRAWKGLWRAGRFGEVGSA